MGDLKKQLEEMTYRRNALAGKEPVITETGSWTFWPRKGRWYTCVGVYEIQAYQSVIKILEPDPDSPFSGGMREAYRIDCCEIYDGMLLAERWCLHQEKEASTDNDDAADSEVSDLEDCEYRPGPACGHSPCSQNYIDTGETGCVSDGP